MSLRDVYVYTFFKKRSKFRHAGLEGKFCHKLKEPTDFMQKKKQKQRFSRWRPVFQCGTHCWVCVSSQKTNG